MAALDKQDRDEARERRIDEYLEDTWAGCCRHPSVVLPVGSEYMSTVMAEVDANNKGAFTDRCIEAATPVGRDTVEAEFDRWLEAARKHWMQRQDVRDWAAEEMDVNEPEDWYGQQNA